MTFKITDNQDNDFWFLSDNITVMRDGEYIGTVPREKADIDGLIKMMVGREMKDIYPKKDYQTGNEAVLRVESLSKKDYFEDISFDIKKGEKTNV